MVVPYLLKENMSKETMMIILVASLFVFGFIIVFQQGEIEDLQTELAEQKEEYEDQISSLREDLKKVSFLLIEYQHQNKVK